MLHGTSYKPDEVGRTINITGALSVVARCADHFRNGLLGVDGNPHAGCISDGMGHDTEHRTPISLAPKGPSGS